MSAAIREQLGSDRAAALVREAALTRELAFLLEATADSPDDEHDPEGATIAFERAQVSALLEATRAHLGEIDAAEARMRAGSYGRCDTCGDAIAEERLLARPTARCCVACAPVGRG